MTSFGNIRIYLAITACKPLFCVIRHSFCQMTPYFEKQKCLNQRRRIDNCLREVSLK